MQNLKKKQLYLFMDYLIFNKNETLIIGVVCRRFIKEYVWQSDSNNAFNYAALSIGFCNDLLQPYFFDELRANQSRKYIIR